MRLKTRIRRAQRRILDGIVGTFPGLALDERAETFVTAVKEFIPQSAKILDIGGGWGFYVEPLRRILGGEVTVLDVVEPSFKKAPVVTYEGDRIPFPDRRFDVSLLVTVLHHVAQPEKLLAEAKRVTRRAVIVVEDLYESSLGKIFTILRDTMFTFEYVGHPRQFRKKSEWRETFTRLGLRPVFEKELWTRILGIPILNGIFVLEPNHG